MLHAAGKYRRLNLFAVALPVPGDPDAILSEVFLPTTRDGATRKRCHRNIEQADVTGDSMAHFGAAPKHSSSVRTSAVTPSPKSMYAAELSAVSASSGSSAQTGPATAEQMMRTAKRCIRTVPRACDKRRSLGMSVPRMRRPTGQVGEAS